MRIASMLMGVAVLLAVPLAAGANTVASSTMWFEGTLTDLGGGAYGGVLAMVKETTAGIGDGVDGYDVYGREGATAWFGDMVGGSPVWTSQTIAGHDAWPTYTPDTPDWYQYSLELTATGWAVRNHAGATEANPWSTNPVAYPARGVPMSGTMNWGTMTAAETDVGAYLPGMGLAEIPGGAAGMGGGAGCWDMDWSWGSEMVPLQYGGQFEVQVTNLGGGEYRVSLTPVPEPLTATGLLLGIGCLGRYLARRRREG